jgi:hypothetical protein
MTEMIQNIKIYLDDIRTPTDPSWVVVRNFDEFVAKVSEFGLESISEISLDHDLGDSAKSEYFQNTRLSSSINYENISEKTGYDAAKWLIDHWHSANRTDEDAIREMRIKKSIGFPLVYTHSANPVGSANIMGYINNFLKNYRMPQNCVRVRIDHT